MRIATSCEHGGGFLRGSCGRAAVAECVYCGKAFCEEHGEQGEDYTNVCGRKTCLKKAIDVIQHLAWKRHAYEFNRVSVCAHEGCEERMGHMCSRCKLQFCHNHVKEHMVVNHSTRPPRKELTIICFHCRDRRALWD